MCQFLFRVWKKPVFGEKFGGNYEKETDDNVACSRHDF